MLVDQYVQLDAHQRELCTDRTHSFLRAINCSAPRCPDEFSLLGVNPRSQPGRGSRKTRFAQAQINAGIYSLPAFSLAQASNNHSLPYSAPVANDLKYAMRY